MSLSYGEAVALAIHMNSMNSGGGEDSSYADRRRIRELKQQKDHLEQRVANLEAQIKNLVETANDRIIHAQRTSSAGWVVMNGMIRAMENLEPTIREQFRSEVINYSQNRIAVLDKSYIDEGLAKGEKYLTIMSLFQKEPEFHAIGFKIP